MIKNGPLNKVEKFYIEQNPESKSPEDLAEELNRSVKQVRNHMISIGKKDKQQITTATKKQYIDDLMIKKERNGQIVATVMSQAASEYTDSQRQKFKSKKIEGSVHNPRRK